MKIIIETLEGGKARKIINDSEEIPVNFIDGNTLENWNKYFNWERNRENIESYGIDYKSYRLQLYKIYSVSVWSELTVDEKLLCATNFVCSGAEQMEAFSGDFNKIIEYGRIFHQYSCEARLLRSDKAIAQIFSRLTKDQRIVIINEIDNAGMLNKYIEKGIEGTESGDGEGLYDYLQSVVGTSYENNGFIDHDYVPTGLSNMTALSDIIMNIAKYGNSIGDI